MFRNKTTHQKEHFNKQLDKAKNDLVMVEYNSQEEYFDHKAQLEKHGIEMGKSIFKYFAQQKFDDYDYTDMYRIFSKACDVVNEGLFDEFMRDKGLIPKFRSIDWNPVTNSIKEDQDQQNE